MMPRVYIGHWGGLTAITVAKLMGCSTKTATRKLKARKLELGDSSITLDTVGDVIFRYRNNPEEQLLERLGKSWNRII